MDNEFIQHMSKEDRPFFEAFFGTQMWSSYKDARCVSIDAAASPQAHVINSILDYKYEAKKPKDNKKPEKANSGEKKFESKSKERQKPENLEQIFKEDKLEDKLEEKPKDEIEEKSKDELEEDKLEEKLEEDDELEEKLKEKSKGNMEEDKLEEKLEEDDELEEIRREIGRDEN